MSVGDRVQVSLEVQIGQAVATLNSLITGLKGLQSQITQVKSTAAGGLVSGDPLRGLGAAINTAEAKVTTFGSKLRGLGTAVGQQATSFGVATASIWGAYNAYDSLVKVELRAETASNRVKTMTTTLATLQERHTEALKKHNLTATEMAILEERITNTKAKLATAQAREADLQGDVNEAWAGFASQIGPQVIAAGASILQLVTNLNQSFPKTGGLVNTLKNAFINLIPSLKSAKAESLLLGTAVDGAGLTFGKLKGVVPEVEKSVAGLAGGMAPLAAGFGKAETSATNFGNSLSGLKGKLGGIAGLAGGAVGGIGAAVLSDVAAKTQSVFDKYAKTYDPSKRISALGTVFGTPEQQKTYVADVEENQKKMVDAGVTVIDMLSDYFLQTDNVDKKLKAFSETTAGLTSYTDDLDTTVKKAVPTMNELATSGSGWVNALIKADTPAKMTAFNAMFKASGKSMDEYQQIVLEANKVLHEHGVATTGVTQKNHLMQTSYEGLTGETAKYASSLKPLPPTYKGLTGETAKYAQKMDDAKTKTQDFSAALLDQQPEVSKNTESYLQLSAGVKGYMDVSGASMSQLQNYSDLIETNVKSLDKEKQKLDDTNTFWAKLKPTMVQHIIATNDAITASIDYTRALTNQDAQQILISEGIKQGTKEAATWFDTLVLGTAKEITFQSSVAQGAETLGIHADMLAFSSGKMQELITNTYKQTLAFDDMKNAAVTSTKWLGDVKIQSTLVNAGFQQGAESANDWTASMIQSVAATKSNHEQLLQLAADMLQIPINSSLSSEELQTLMTRFKETGDAAGSLAEVMSSRLAPSFEHLKGLFDATSMKDFKNSLKDLSISKDLKGDIKDLGKSLVDLAKNRKSAQDTFDVLLQFGDEILKKHPKDWAKFVGDLADKLAKGAGKKGLTEDMKQFIDTVKTMSPDELQTHAKSVQMFIDAFQPGSEGGKTVTPGEWGKIIAEFNKEGKEVSPSIDPATASTDALGTAFAAMGLNGVAARAQVDMVTGGVDVMNQAFEKSNPVIKVNPQPGLDAIAKATSTFGIWFDMVQRSNPAMKANPAAALTAINKVSTVFGIVFDTIQRSNPAMKVNNSNALSGIKAVQSAIDKLPASKETTLTVHHVDTFEKKTLGGRFGGSFIVPGMQHGGAFIANTAQNFKGVNIAEFNKPELVTVTPLTDPNNISDRTIKVTTQHVDQFRKPSTSGPIHVHIDSPIYLYPNGEMVGRMQRKYVLDNVGKYPNVQ